MQWLQNARVRTKMTLLTGLALLMLVVVGGGAMAAGQVLQNQAQSLILRELRPAMAMGDARSAIGGLQAAYLRLRTGSGAVSTGVHRNELQDQETRFAKALEQLQIFRQEAQRAEMLTALEGSWQEYLTAREKIWQAYDQAGLTGVDAIAFQQADSALVVAESLLYQLGTDLQKEADQAENAVIETTRLFNLAGIVSFLVGAVVLYFLARTIRISLQEPVIRLTDLAEQIGAGNLGDLPSPVTRRDELGRLHNSIVQMAQNMRSLLAEVGHSAQAVQTASDAMLANSEEVSRAADQLALAIQHVASGATGQSESVQEAVRVMEQMREAIRQVTRGAQEQAGHVAETNRVSAQAGEAVQVMDQRVSHLQTVAESSHATAESGIATVNRALAAMEQMQRKVESSAGMVQALEEESRQIRQAVTLITEIADQTNLLALNAAIEAARAGESGRGFAVVAEEVRQLAERSARSAGEIADLIRSVESRTSAVASAMREGQAAARESAALAAGTGETLRSIADGVLATVEDIRSLKAASAAVMESTQAAVAAVDQIASVIEENTATTEEMAASSDQVDETVRSIAGVAQSTAATAQEVSASVEELSATTEHVAETARQLAGVSGQLKQHVSRFQV